MTQDCILLPLSQPQPDHDLVKCDKALRRNMGSILDSNHGSIELFWQGLSLSSPGNL